METSGTATDRRTPLDDLARVVAAEGPFLTAYLTTEGDVENAAQRSELRWKNLRAEAAEAGADEAVLAAVDPLVADAHQWGGCLAAVATTDGLRHLEYGPETRAGDLAVWSSLPRLAQVVEWRQTSPPFVVVLTDRTGADLYAFRREGPDIHRDERGEEASRVKPGGWSQRRFQERAENTWDRNARAVAEAVVRLATQVRARLIVAAGDVRAMQLLREALPDQALDRLDVRDGEVWEGRSIDDVRDDIETVVRATADRDTASLLETWQEERGQADRATDGPEATIDALRRAQVEVLLLHDDPEDRRWAWFGPSPTDLSTDLDAIRAAGVATPREGRLVDVLVRAALGTGADVRIVPAEGGPRDGVGAVLRWSD
ncbi:MAG TPA: Vms1/Ankzf1 family peptidyl-tRNA hydrolase [Actinomycetota bacterium]|nr:Vms1/Ankzf1 family peptidyl-tRNA hydrolase [Actinomycetota bacterium]